MKIGEGSYGVVYSAYDKYLKENVAIKVLKKNKNPEKIHSEFSKLTLVDRKNKLFNIKSKIIKPYTIFYDEDNQLSFSMQLKGMNLKQLKEDAPNKTLSYVQGVGIAMQMLRWINQLHSYGIVHCDIKPSNFVVGPDGAEHDIILIDLGAAKYYRTDGMIKREVEHLKFKGSPAYASLNAHNYRDLSWRDDMISWYFWTLEMLNEKLEWKSLEKRKESIMEIKEKWLKQPELYLWTNKTWTFPEVKEIWYYIASLEYDQIPNYKYIDNLLKKMMFKSVMNKRLSSIKSISESNTISKNNTTKLSKSIYNKLQTSVSSPLNKNPLSPPRISNRTLPRLKPALLLPHQHRNSSEKLNPHYLHSLPLTISSPLSSLNPLTKSNWCDALINKDSSLINQFSLLLSSTFDIRDVTLNSVVKAMTQENSEDSSPNNSISL